LLTLATLVVTAGLPGTPAAVAQAATLVVATDGDDANPGTLDQPLRTVQRAVDLAGPGTTIEIRGGSYAPETNIQVNVDGQLDAPITMRPYQGEPVLIGQAWSAEVNSSGADVTADNVSWNGALPASGRTAFGFIGSYASANNPPTLTCAPR
jgi:hypothetical protein